LESIRDRVLLGTFKPYEAIVRLHIKPTLGRTKLDKLNAMQLEKLYRQKLVAGLTARRVRYIHVIFRKAVKDAVRLQLLSRNVAGAAIPPRAAKTEIEPLTQDQMRWVKSRSFCNFLQASSFPYGSIIIASSGSTTSSSMRRCSPISSMSK
jgi:integrase